MSAFTQSDEPKEEKLMRSTEVKKGSSRGDCQLNGQWNKFTLYCPQCHAHDGRPHSKGCANAFVKISSIARIPRANASKRQWQLFNEKFVQRLIPIDSVTPLPPPKVRDLRYNLRSRRKRCLLVLN
jgi:hypothetical protein